ncbi:MAG: hypothetical protein HC795_17295 [Coleofasciculaceae cyanobacterium RL_1_1]|nr:hypothetical protein [Coleofasciculaceae cyanobacterium RL_1_1]
MTQIQLEQTLLQKFRQLPEPFQPIVLNLVDSLLALPIQPHETPDETRPPVPRWNSA